MDYGKEATTTLGSTLANMRRLSSVLVPYAFLQSALLLWVSVAESDVATPRLRVAAGIRASDRRTSETVPTRVLAPSDISAAMINISQSMDNLLNLARDMYAELRAFKTQISDRMDKVEAALNNSSVREEIDDLKRDLGNISTSVEKLKETTDDAARKVETSLLQTPGLRARYNWTRTWDERLEPVSRYKISWFVSRAKLNYVATQPPHKLLSSSFELGGYVMKFLLEIFSSDGKQRYGIYFIFCPGPKDSFLEWPFRTQFTLAINHPVLKRQTRRSPPEIFGDNSGTVFQRPQRQCNTDARGNARLLTVSEAEHEGFLMNDDLHISMELHPDH